MTLSAEPNPADPADERIERPSVEELLDRAIKRRICVVIGAAGWGKTTAVATWSRDRPTVWVRYEDHEGDAERLAAALFGALRTHGSVPAPVEDVASTDLGSSIDTMCAYLRACRGG